MSFLQQKLSAALLVVAGMLASAPAAASFHLWFMNQVYSNASGSVQFLELTALAPEQQFTSFHSLKAEGGGVTHTYSLTTNLPGDTSQRKFLFGTQSFAALGIVQPDYVVPDNFFPIGGGTITWAEGADVWTYQPVPTDGTLALNRDNSTTTNAPVNFAGQSGTVTAGAAPGGGGGAANNYQALWWRSPAGSESGWGVNITHQGNILFATWFTYDSSNKGMWLVMSDGEKQAGTATDTYSGALFTTTGPAFNAQPFDPSQVHVTQVGTATFSFTDANNGTFSYTVNGVSQSKPITRQVFSSPTPTCAAGGTAPATPNFSDLWWASPAGSESGWGVNLQHQGNIVFATWFTYDSAGKGLWVVMSDGEKTGTNTYSGALFTTTGPAFNANPWDPNQVHVTQVGTATFTFANANTGTFAYTLNGVSQTKSITRQVFSTPATVCR
jgi:hypothetical protein